MTERLFIDSDTDTHPGSEKSRIEREALRVVPAAMAQTLRSAPQPAHLPIRPVGSTTPPETTWASERPSLS